MKHTMTLLLLAFPCICLAGCQEQPRRFPISGTVLIDGKPLTSGSLRFVAENGRPATSEIMGDGSFQLSESKISSADDNSGVLPGRYRVAVSAAQVLDEGANDVRWLAPSKYADFRTSGIEVTVDGTQTDLQIDLTWKGNEPTEDESAAEDSPAEDSPAEDSPAEDSPAESSTANGPSEEAPQAQ